MRPSGRVMGCLSWVQGYNRSYTFTIPAMYAMRWNTVERKCYFDEFFVTNRTKKSSKWRHFQCQCTCSCCNWEYYIRIDYKCEMKRRFYDILKPDKKCTYQLLKMDCFIFKIIFFISNDTWEHSIVALPRLSLEIFYKLISVLGFLQQLQTMKRLLWDCRNMIHFIAW